MRRIHPAVTSAALLAAAGLLACAAPGRSQEFARSKTIYAGETGIGDGVKLGGWGSGMATGDRAHKTVGDSSIRVETNGYYAGARIAFDSPVAVTDQKADPYGYLEMIIRFQPGTRRTSAARSSQPMDPFGDMGSSADSGEMGSGFGSGFPGATPGAAPEAILPDTRKLKVVLMCDEGTFTVSGFPVAMFPAQEEGWFSVAIPFSAFKGLEKAATANIQEIRVFGDTKDTFWIGEIRTTTDDEPITVDGLDDLEVSVGEPVEFRATASGGISPLQYIWDFDQSDGPNQEDATGQSVVHVFRKRSPDVPGRPGELQPLVVTLTVRDLAGAKKPERRTATVIVNP